MEKRLLMVECQNGVSNRVRNVAATSRLLKRDLPTKPISARRSG
jgi:hypothetical protein